MSAQSNAPVIYKKVKKVSGGGHHGGAWKVAYADFVTAMMAFFMLMWLLNATTEKQRKGIADYFSPTIPITRASGGGDGAFGGDSVFTDEALAHTGHGGVPGATLDNETDHAGSADGSADNGEAQALEELGEILTGNSGESMASELARRHIVTQLTDEGLVIEVFDLDEAPLFRPETAEPMPVMEELVELFATVFDLVRNGIAIEGHVASRPVVVAHNTAWDLSSDRAAQVREMLEGRGIAPDRLRRVTGHADRKPAAGNPLAVRNNRIELILLRTKR